jgi:hypothetical protein
MMMVPTKFLPLAETRLFSWRAKIRMGLEIFRQPRGPQPDRSVYEFLLDHYGQECIDYLAEPLLAGVYGGDPREMSVNSVLGRFVEIESKYGSLTRGALATPRPQNPGGSFLQTLKGGLGQLVEALRPSADVVQAEVEPIAIGWKPSISSSPRLLMNPRALFRIRSLNWPASLPAFPIQRPSPWLSAIEKTPSIIRSKATDSWFRR